MKLRKAVGCIGRETGSDMTLDLFDPDAPSRQQVEQFIHRIFARAYNADLNHYFPRLMALHGENDRMVATLGIREASSSALFLENYLDAPVEDLISQLQGTSVSRNRIVEVGNLASVHRGGMRQLIIALTSYLTGAGTEWIVFTAVPAVREAFAALDLNLHPIAAADKTRLDPTEQMKWGRYYDAGPLVVAGKVEEGYLRLRELIGLETALSISSYLWQYAFAVGRRQRVTNLKLITQGRENQS